MTDAHEKDDMKMTHMLTQWGQFLDHDITSTPEEEMHCCSTEDVAAECFPIRIGGQDSFYSPRNKTCLDFSRYIFMLMLKSINFYRNALYNMNYLFGEHL